VRCGAATSTTGWEAWFHVKASPIAGRGLYAARPFAHKDAMVTYMGRDSKHDGGRVAFIEEIISAPQQQCRR